MIFVILGSQKFQFNRLLRKLDELLEQGIVKEQIFAQIGYSDYRPIHYEYKDFLDRDRFALMLDKCETVITHGGTGAIISAIKKGKKVIAVPRLASYGEHVDNHQLQLINQFDEMQLICSCKDIDKLNDAMKEVTVTEYRNYESNTMTIIKALVSYIE
ncbi:MAG: PssE/Cps14G family polysaccharide biosynthesis glycosyltransferase [Anaerocolumna sp.]